MALRKDVSFWDEIIRVVQHLVPTFAVAFAMTINSACANPLGSSASVSAGATAAIYSLDSSWTPKWNFLVGYWKLNELVGAGTVADSSAGGTFSGTTIGGVTLGVTGKLRTAATFNGSTGVINITNPAALQFTSGTLAAWVNTSGPGAGHRGILVKESAYGLFAFNGNLAIYDWSVSATRDSGVSISDGQWHFVAMTFQSGVAGGTFLYLDGVSVLTTTMTVNSQAQPVTIGNNNLGNSQFFGGTIDDASFWSTPLTPADITTIYQKQLANIPGS